MRTLAGVAGSLAVATLGGVLFRHLGVPLPWILGALAGAALWSNLAGPASGGRYQRRAAQLILGTGSAAILTPRILSEMLGFLPLMLLAAIVANGAAILSATLFARVGGVGRLTALLCVLPAGLAEMSSLAEDRNARPDVVALSHSVRVAIIVILVPLVLGASRGAALAPVAGGSAVALMSCLGASALAAMMLSRLGMLNPWIVTPMLFGTGLALAGIEMMRVPPPLLVLAQILVGASLGSRLQSEVLGRLPRVVLAASLSTLLVGLALLALVAPLVMGVAGADAVTASLALAPGGLGEMLATAQALHAVVPVVLGFQFIRSLSTNLFAPVVIARLAPIPDREG